MLQGFDRYLISRGLFRSPSHDSQPSV